MGSRSSDDDEEDFVFIGTPIEREDDQTSTRKQKSLALTSGTLRTLPSWKQEVLDDEGRRRFHGAFTGGFSAGYYNTVGSKEGWTPQTFSSSRKSRAEAKKQTVLDFLDEDEKAEMEGHLLGTQSQFDTFGFTAKEIAHQQAEKEQKQRPSAIPGPVPDELVVPATESIGVKLLLKMGWRQGRSIKDSSSKSIDEVRREARKAFLALSHTDNADGSESFNDELDDFSRKSSTVEDQSSQSIPVFVRQPKQDLYGLGYDPYKHAPEFREKKRSRLSDKKETGFRKPFSSNYELGSSKSGRLAPGFGIGALEQHDAEDDDIYGPGLDYAEAYVLSDEDLSQRVDDKNKPAGNDLGFVPRFEVESGSEYQVERFEPPTVPKDFVARHKFPAPLDTNYLIKDSSPPEAPPPEDNNLKVMIEGVAALVARCGQLFEDISREKHKSNSLFSFLNGGNGHDYYARKLWEERQKRNGQTKSRPGDKPYSTVQKLTAESRGNILGERPLERTIQDPGSSQPGQDDVQCQSNLSDAFTKPEVFRELLQTAKPFKDDPAKQDRFEQFLKDKYQGGLRSTVSGKASIMSEDARAHERLNFEAAAEAIEKEKSSSQSKLSAQQLLDFTMATGLQFTAGGVEHGNANSAEELTSRKLWPKREEFQWRPAPLLCKRFDIVDPYMGKPPPPPRMRSKLDSLMFTPDSVKNVKSEGIKMSIDQSSLPSKNNDDFTVEMREPEVAVEVDNVERPVDLYKAIFSDDSDDEEDSSGVPPAEDPQKKTEAASAALSRLVAGDFLESLGKELGLEVPPDLPPAASTTGSSTLLKDGGSEDIAQKDLVPSASDDYPTERKALKQELDIEDRAQQRSPKNWKSVETPNLKKVGNDVKLDKRDRKDRKEKYDDSSSSGDERSRKRSRSHRRRRSSSDRDSTDDSGDRDRYHSRSRDKKKKSSRSKHRRRKHSKH